MMQKASTSHMRVYLIGTCKMSILQAAGKKTNRTDNTCLVNMKCGLDLY